MEKSLADLSLSVEEEEDLQIDPSNLEHHISEACLVGRFLQTKHIYFQSMQNRMAEIWCPVKGVFIREIGDQRHLFKFFHEFDMERDLEGGPWTFDNQFLILKHLKQGDVPTLVELHMIPFWIQIYELPIGYISETIGKQLGDFIGRFITYDSSNNAGFWRTYMRIRVDADVRKSLKRCKNNRKPDGNLFMVQFKYEKLGYFCFVCGCLGHTERFCEVMFSSNDKNIKREWGLWLRAPERRGSAA